MKLEHCCNYDICIIYKGDL